MTNAGARRVPVPAVARSGPARARPRRRSAPPRSRGRPTRAVSCSQTRLAPDVGAGPEPFDRDVELNEGYRYTTNAPLSSRLANDRLTDATLELVALEG